MMQGMSAYIMPFDALQSCGRQEDDYNKQEWQKSKKEQFWREQRQPTALKHWRLTCHCHNYCYIYTYILKQVTDLLALFLLFNHSLAAGCFPSSSRRCWRNRDSTLLTPVLTGLFQTCQFCPNRCTVW